jgi:hypothetical protein
MKTVTKKTKFLVCNPSHSKGRDGERSFPWVNLGKKLAKPHSNKQAWHGAASWHST